MVDYYKEFNIPKTAGIGEIHDILAKQRNTWEDRNSKGFEAAAEKLILLKKADEAFKNETTRQQYDRKLADSKKAPENTDTNSDRKVSFDKWFNDANKYLDTQQYDLAKAALERALLFTTSESLNSEFVECAAAVYLMTGDLQQAMKYANYGILLNPDNASKYLDKASVLEDMIFKQYTRSTN